MRAESDPKQTLEGADGEECVSQLHSRDMGTYLLTNTL